MKDNINHLKKRFLMNSRDGEHGRIRREKENLGGKKPWSLILFWRMGEFEERGK